MYKCIGRTIQTHTLRHMLESKFKISTQAASHSRPVLSMSMQTLQHHMAQRQHGTASAWQTAKPSIYFFLLLWPHANVG